MNWILGVVFLIQLVILYFISRVNIQKIFEVLRMFVRKDSFVFSLIAFIFLPGTILHELSHFFMATILLLKVREIHIFPKWDNGYIKLGSVVFEKKDVARSILVGIAPIIVGLLFFWWLSALRVMEINGFGIKAILIYVIFVLSTSMFSSKQDLVDIIYVIPICIVIGIIVYFFSPDFSFITKQDIVIEALQKFLYDVTSYLYISLAIHCLLLLILYLTLRIAKK